MLQQIQKCAPLSPLARAVLLAFLVLMVAGCGKASAVVGPAIAVDDLPDGVGRGFPVASVERAGAMAPTLRIGDEAPNFFMTTVDGRTMTLDSLRGRPVVINHWATWCPPCRLEMPEIVKAAEVNPDLVVLAANHMEDSARVEAFAREFGMQIPVVLDAEGKLSDLFSVRAFPTTTFVDREGRIAAEWVGVLTPEKLSELLEKVL